MVGEWGGWDGLGWFGRVGGLGWLGRVVVWDGLGQLGSGMVWKGGMVWDDQDGLGGLEFGMVWEGWGPLSCLLQPALLAGSSWWPRALL